MKSIDQLLKLSTNKHYHLKKSELDLLDRVARKEFELKWAELNDTQRDVLFTLYPCKCGDKK